jgi:hypothetical protein
MQNSNFQNQKAQNLGTIFTTPACPVTNFTEQILNVEQTFNTDNVHNKLNRDFCKIGDGASGLASPPQRGGENRGFAKGGGIPSCLRREKPRLCEVKGGGSKEVIIFLFFLIFTPLEVLPIFYLS